MSRYGKHPAFHVWEDNPFNAEPPLDLLAQNPVTPVDLFYVRNHGPAPEVDPATYRLTVDGLVTQPLQLSLAALRDAFPHTVMPATLQCAGNRRVELLASGPMPGEVPWQHGAISNGTWGGVLLRDVLQAAGLVDGARHVAFTGLDHVVRHGEPVGFGGSVSLDAVMTLDVLLAYELNGEPLPVVHGFPLRVVAPGHIGARSVKWLSGVTVQPEPSTHYFQAHAYKLFPPSVNADNVDWDQGLMLSELSVNSVICAPEEGATVGAGPTLVRGYAMAGGRRTVERVDLSLDGGATWRAATLLGEARPGVWRLWEAQVELPPGETELVCRAWDSAANTQPESAQALWNFKGYMNNAWRRVRVRRN